MADTTPVTESLFQWVLGFIIAAIIGGLGFLHRSLNGKVDSKEIERLEKLLEDHMLDDKEQIEKLHEEVEELDTKIMRQFEQSRNEGRDVVRDLHQRISEMRTQDISGLRKEMIDGFASIRDEIRALYQRKPE